MDSKDGSWEPLLHYWLKQLPEDAAPGYKKLSQ